MPENTNKRRIGDRKDGRLLRSFPAYNKFTPYIMRQRNDAFILFQDCVEVTEIDRWLRAQRAAGYKGMGLLHVIVAAYVRTVSQRPGINRFVSGKKIFARNNIEVIMTIKRTMSDDSEETTAKFKFLPSDTVYDVYRKMNEQIDEIRANESTGTDDFAEKASKLPRFVISSVVAILRAMDYFGILPQSLLEISPFHGSMIITDLGSIGIKPVFHHIYNFGNLPIFLAFGAKRRTIEVTGEGRAEERKYVDFTATLDERISDGYYLANSFKYIKHYMKNPSLLETPPEKVEQDIF